jgi:hypothetical protein
LREREREREREGERERERERKRERERERERDTNFLKAFYLKVFHLKQVCIPTLKIINHSEENLKKTRKTSSIIF